MEKRSSIDRIACAHCSTDESLNSITLKNRFSDDQTNIVGIAYLCDECLKLAKTYGVAIKLGKPRVIR